MNYKELEKHISDEIKVGGYAVSDARFDAYIVKVDRETPRYWVVGIDDYYDKKTLKLRGSSSAWDTTRILPLTKARLDRFSAKKLAAKLGDFGYSKLTLDQLQQLSDLLDSFKDK